MSITQMIETGSVNPVLLFVLALILGSLHGLEPGHSKTMMAAYIIAVQGTVKQAILLGVSAAFSHSIIVWVLAILALTLGNEMIGEELEPWFLIVSGVLVLGIAGWMLLQTLRPSGHDHHHDHNHSHAQAHGHGHDHQYAHSHDHHHHGDPHLLGTAGHPNVEVAGLEDQHMDAHASAHAAEIRARIAIGRIGTWQTILFGLSGGLIPCPAAITVFLLCLHLGQLTLGITLVSAFSIGLAITLVAIGVVAALGLRYVSARTSSFERIMQLAPWISAALIALVGVVIIWSGISHLDGVSHHH
ncbi:MAG: nickel/cobalt efflux transporter [Pseudomonadota bacterium]